MIVKNRGYKWLFLAIICMIFIATPAISQNNLTKIKTVCLDAGHGGKDPGAVGLSSKEKDIVLAITLKLGKLIKESYPDINVVYTRKTDVFVDLKRRSQIANDSKADLFISIHINSAPESKTARGIETLVLGTNSSELNMKTAMRENSALKYESDYSIIRESFDPNKPESYIIFNLIRNVHLNESLLFASLAQDGLVKTTGWRDRNVKQQPVWVLKDASMPAVLVEVGFISNAQEERALRTESTKNAVAKSLFNSFVEYKKRMESNNSVLQIKPEEKVTQSAQVEQKASSVNTKVPETKEEKKQEEPKKETVNEVKTVQQQPVSLKQEKQQDWFYAIQIASLLEPAKSSSAFGVSETVHCFADGNRYKYYICKSKSYDEVSKKAAQIREKIKGAFVIGIKDGKIANVADLRVLENNK